VFKSLLIFGFCLLAYSAAKTQSTILFNKPDTLTLSIRTGGNDLDSIDVKLFSKYNNLPGGYFNNPYQSSSSFISGLALQTAVINSAPIKFSSLPHLGVYYSFGAYGIQNLNVNFNQTYRKNIHFALDYKRAVSNGVYRLNSFSLDQFRFAILQDGNKLKNTLNFELGKNNRELNGGISSDTLIEDFGLPFVSVNKLNSKDSVTNVQFSTSHYLKLNTDSAANVGVVLQSKFANYKRVYIEIDSLYKIYTSYDNPFSTRDLSHFSRIDIASGIYFTKKYFSSEFLVDKGYWSYSTNAHQIRNELDLRWNFLFEKNKFRLFSEVNKNIVGAEKQQNIQVSLRYRNEKCFHSFKLAMNKLLPIPMQRMYFSNTLDWVTNNLQLQVQNAISYTFLQSTGVKFYFLAKLQRFKNTYFFVDDIWRNDTLSALGQFTMNSGVTFKFRNFYFQPNLKFTYMTNTISLFPKSDVKMRVFWKQKFKNNLEVLVGSDFSYQSTYQLLDFDTRVSLYTFSNTNQFYNTMLGLDAFISIAINEIRFFFKYENISYKWNNKRTQIVNNYVIVPDFMRLGFTWDFFN
jgi:hypothetical protein